MKKNLFITNMLLFIAFASHAQQWSGPNNTTGAIYRSGNVGIGTTTPNNKLQVNGTAFVNNDVVVRKFLYVGDDATNNGTLDIRFGSNNFGSGEGIGSKRTAGGNQYGLDFYTASANRMVITNGGNVGIGTTTPNSKLQVNGSAFVNNDVVVRKFLYVGDDATNNGTLDIRFGSNNFGSGEGIGSKRTASGNQYGLDFYTASLNRMAITNAGLVGVGLTNPNWRFQVNGGNDISIAIGEGGTGEGFGSRRAAGANQFGLDFYTNFQKRVSITNTGNVGIGTLAPSYKLDVSGVTRSTGGYITSDKRFKENIQPIEAALDKIMALRGTTYTFRSTEFKDMNFVSGGQLGFIAQEIKEVLPELVSEDDKGYYSVNYDGLVPVLVEALKEQQAQIEEKEATIQTLETKVDDLESRLAKLEQLLAGQPAVERSATTKTTTSQAMKIFPNPNKGEFNIQFPAVRFENAAFVVVRDMNGREVATQSVEKQATSVQLNLSNLDAGTYFCQLFLDGKMTGSEKVMVVK